MNTFNANRAAGVALPIVPLDLALEDEMERGVIDFPARWRRGPLKPRVGLRPVRSAVSVMKTLSAHLLQRLPVGVRDDVCGGKLDCGHWGLSIGARVIRLRMEEFVRSDDEQLYTLMCLLTERVLQVHQWERQALRLVDAGAKVA